MSRLLNQSRRLPLVLLLSSYALPRSSDIYHNSGNETRVAQGIRESITTPLSDIEPAIHSEPNDPDHICQRSWASFMSHSIQSTTDSSTIIDRRNWPNCSIGSGCYEEWSSFVQSTVTHGGKQILPLDWAYTQINSLLDAQVLENPEGMHIDRTGPHFFGGCLHLNLPFRFCIRQPLETPTGPPESLDDSVDNGYACTCVFDASGDTLSAECPRRPPKAFDPLGTLAVPTLPLFDPTIPSQETASPRPIVATPAVTETKSLVLASSVEQESRLPHFNTQQPTSQLFTLPPEPTPIAGVLRQKTIPVTLTVGSSIVTGSVVFDAEHGRPQQLVAGSLSLQLNSPMTRFKGESVQMKDEGIVLGSVTLPYPVLGVSTNILFDANGQRISGYIPAGSAGEVVIGASTLKVGGLPATINGQIVSLATNGIVVDGTLASNLNPAPTSTPKPPAGTQSTSVTVSGQTTVGKAAASSKMRSGSSRTLSSPSDSYSIQIAVAAQVALLMRFR